MQKKFSWKGYVYSDRTQAINLVKDAILTCDGCIMHFTMFSDLALSLNVEIEECRVLVLHKTLAKVLTISEFEINNWKATSTKDVSVFLNISFADGKGKMKKVVPKVPG